MQVTVDKPAESVQSDTRFNVDFTQKKVYVHYREDDVPKTHTVEMTETNFNNLKAELRPMALAVPNATDCEDPTFS